VGLAMVDTELYSVLAQLVLALHVGIIAFNVVGLVVIPLGAWRGWRFVRVFWWRALHLAILAVVVAQALFARACFLTLWQSALQERAGETTSSTPLIARWVHDLLFWPLPLWFFAVLYVLVCLYALLLWRLVPPRPRTARG
jgi:hypothetical protein